MLELTNHLAAKPNHLMRRRPGNKGRRYPADPPRVEEIVAVMRQAGTDHYGRRLRGLIIVLWRAGLRISEALALMESDLEINRGSVLVRRGKGGRRREVGSFEGFVPIPEDLTPCDPSLRDREYRPVTELYRHAAALAMSGDDVLGEDPIITQLRDFLELGVRTVHDFEDFLGPRSHFRSPPVDLSKPGNLRVLLPDDIGAKQSDERIDIESVGSGGRFPYKLSALSA